MDKVSNVIRKCMYCRPNEQISFSKFSFPYKKETCPARELLAGTRGTENRPLSVREPPVRPFGTENGAVVYAANIAVPGYSTLPPIYYNLKPKARLDGVPAGGL